MLFYSGTQKVNIDTSTISITQNGKHIITITDKTADKEYKYKTIKVKKENISKKPIYINTDTITIKANGRYYYINDKIAKKIYNVKN